MGKRWALGAQHSADEGGGRGRAWTHTGLSEAPSSRAVFKSGSGGGKSRREELRGLAGKPQRKGKGPGADATMNNTDRKLRQGPLQHPLKTKPSAQLGGLGLYKACLSHMQRHLPGEKSEPKHQPCPTAAWGCGAVSVGTRPSSASGSSDSWGDKESHSPGNGSPHWCLLGPQTARGAPPLHVFS